MVFYISLCLKQPNSLMVPSLCREGRPSSTYEDEDTAHRRKTRKKTFKLKWRRRDRVGEDSGARTYEPTGPVDDQFVVKVCGS